VVLTPQRLASSWRKGKSARPGADAPVIRRRRRQESPILRGEREISRKAIAQGMSDCLRCPVCSCAIFVLPFARETAGAARIRHSLLPLLRDNETQTSGASRRENADVYPLFDIRIEALDPSLPGSEATKQSTLRMTAMDCFRLRSLSYGGQVAEPVIGRAFARPVGSQ